MLALPVIPIRGEHALELCLGEGGVVGGRVTEGERSGLGAEAKLEQDLHGAVLRRVEAAGLTGT